MHLCNVAFSHIEAGELVRAIIPAILGMAEDTVDGWDQDPVHAQNFRNLLVTRYPEDDARLLANLFVETTRWRGRAPLHPEAVFRSAEKREEFFQPNLISVLSKMAGNFRSETIPESLNTLAKVWGEFRP